jgi:hypothetical protein
MNNQIARALGGIIRVRILKAQCPAVAPLCDIAERCYATALMMAGQCK